MAERDWHAWDAELRTLLQPQAPPLAITFSQDAPPGVPAYDAPMPAATADGRTGRVPAGCVFLDNGFRITSLNPVAADWWIVLDAHTRLEEHGDISALDQV